jgi:hypothetical protein
VFGASVLNYDAEVKVNESTISQLPVCISIQLLLVFHSLTHDQQLVLVRHGKLCPRKTGRELVTPQASLLLSY